MLLAVLTWRAFRYVIEKPQWLFNNAGGAMGSMLVLHCSLSGTPC